MSSFWLVGFVIVKKVQNDICEVKRLKHNEAIIFNTVRPDLRLCVRSTRVRVGYRGQCVQANHLLRMRAIDKNYGRWVHNREPPFGGLGRGLRVKSTQRIYFKILKFSVLHRETFHDETSNRVLLSKNFLKIFTHFLPQLLKFVKILDLFVTNP